jgi:hypothetical protein
MGRHTWTRCVSLWAVNGDSSSDWEARYTTALEAWRQKADLADRGPRVPEPSWMDRRAFLPLSLRVDRLVCTGPGDDEAVQARLADLRDTLMPWLTVSLRGERLLVAAAWRDDADFFRPRFKGRLHVDGEIVRIEGALAPNAAAWIILAMLLALAAVGCNDTVGGRRVHVRLVGQSQAEPAAACADRVCAGVAGSGTADTGQVNDKAISNGA